MWNKERSRGQGHSDMTAEVLNIQIKQEIAENCSKSGSENDIEKLASKNAEDGSKESSMDVTEDEGEGKASEKGGGTEGEKSPVGQGVYMMAGGMDGANASEQLQRMIQQQYLVNLIQFQQSMLQVFFFFSK